MADPLNLTDTQFLETDPDVLGLQRQRQLANLLTGQAFNAPQGQMISGRYVKPSGLQQALPMINAAIGGLTNANLDTKQQELAAALRGKQAEIAQRFASGTPQEKLAAALDPNAPAIIKAAASEMFKTQKAGKGDIISQMNFNTGKFEPILEGAPDLHSVDGNLVDSKGNVLFKAPKVFAPHATQLVPVQGGFAEYNPNTRTLTPIGGSVGGAPSGPLMPPLSADVAKDIKELNQQKSIINNAIKGVEANRQYFGGKYAAPELLGGELGQAAMNAKLPEGAVEARSNVFNTASAVIKERAGTAQTPSEKTIIMRFLPSIYDSDATVIKKLNAYNEYIESKAAGTTATPGAVPAYKGQPTPSQNKVPAVGTKQDGYVFLGGDPANPSSWRKE